MATGSYDGGAGGKFRRRPFRRPSTPYDRPPVAPRNPNGTERGGWLSKLVDPASRIIARSASRFFQTVFRGRLPALTAASHEPGRDIPTSVFVSPLREQEQVMRYERDDQINNKSDTSQIHREEEQENIIGASPINDKCYSSGINEFEQLLRQKTFTREEFDRLTELLRSRTVDVYTTEETARGTVDGKRTEPRALQSVATREGKEEAGFSARENGVGNFGLSGVNSTPAAGLTVFEQEIASPAELAKAYMGGRTLRVSPSTLGLRSRTFREDPTLLNIVPFNTPKKSNMSFAPKSASHISENGYLTPRTRGRSPMYNMARSPYVRAPSTAFLKRKESIEGGYPRASTSSEQIHANNMLSSGGRQALKRRSSISDIDLGSGGPIRRIRQKSNLMTTVTEKECNRASNVNYSSVPPQSSEMARKILQQLDQLVSSPKEKSSESKLALAREKSPSKLNMLNVQPLGSTENIESPTQQNLRDNDSLDGLRGGTCLPGPGNTFLQKKDKNEVNGLSKISTVGFKLAVEGDTAVKNTMFSHRAVDSSVLVSAISPSRDVQGFQLSAPEDSLELDNSYISRASASTSVPPQNEKMVSSSLETKAVTEVGGDKPLLSSSESSKPAASYTFSKGSYMNRKVSIPGPTAGENSLGFFPPTSPPITLPVPLSLATAESSLLLNSKSALPKEQQAGVPTFNFGDKTLQKGSMFSFGSSITNGSHSSGMKDFKTEASSRDATGAALSSVSLPETTVADKSEKTQKVGDVFRPSEDASFPALSTSTTQRIFPFGASSNSTLSNGFQTSSSSAVSVSPTFGLFCSSSASMPSSSRPLTPASSPILSAGPNFKFGSETSSSNCISPTTTSSSLEPTNAGEKSKAAFPFSSPMLASPAFTSTSSGIFGFSTLSSSSAASSSSSANNQSLSSAAPLGNSAAGPVVGSQTAPITNSVGSQFGLSSSTSSTFGLIASSSFGSGSFQFRSSTFSDKPVTTVSSFGVNSSVTFGSGSASSSSASSTSTSLIGSNTQATSSTTSSLFGSGPQPANAITLFGSASQPASATTSLFGSGSQPASSASTLFGSSSKLASANSFFASRSESSTFGFGSSSASPSSGFSFGQSNMPTGSGSLPFGSSFGASSGPSMFSFTAAAATTSSSSLSSAQPVFHISNPTTFGLASPSNDQMNVEDSMAEDTIQNSTMPVAASFGQPANSPPPSNFMFGSPPIQSGRPSVFQFGGQQNPGTPQSPSLFSAPQGSLELTPGGSFSLGTGGTDKSNRRIIKVKRDKLRKK